MAAKDCIFCKIINKEVKTELVLETDSIVAFDDVNPVSQVHVLIVPKRHMESVLTIAEGDSKEVVAMFKTAQKIVVDKKLEAFRLAFNGGRYQHVPHLHMHLLAGGRIEWSKL